MPAPCWGIPIRLVGQIFGAKVAGQDDQRIAEVYRAALTIGQAAIIKHLQQDVEYILMRLFHLVKQDDLIRAAAYGFGQHATFFIPHIARRCADQTGHGVLFHELAHVNAQQGFVIVKQEAGERFGQLRFANTRRAEEQERPDRAVGVL